MVSVNCGQAKPCAKSWNPLDIWNEADNSSWLNILHTQNEDIDLKWHERSWKKEPLLLLSTNLLGHPSVIFPVLFFARHFVVLRYRNKMHENFVHLCPPFWKNTNFLYVRVMECNVEASDSLWLTHRSGPGCSKHDYLRWGFLLILFVL